MAQLAVLGFKGLGFEVIVPILSAEVKTNGFPKGVPVQGNSISMFWS